MGINYIENKDQIGFKIEARNESGQIVGTCWATRVNDAITFANFYVEKPVRRQGIGTEIYNRMESWGIENGAERVVAIFDPDEDASPDAVKRFYENRGLTVTETLVTGDLKKR